MKVKISSYGRLGSRDYLIVAVIDELPVAYGVIDGRRYVALGRNTSRLKELFKSCCPGVIVAKRYVYEVSE